MDFKAEMILDEYRENLETFKKMREIILDQLKDFNQVNPSGIVNSIEARVKTEHSLAGKLALKGDKYSSLSDLTDIVGARVVCFYEDEVDKMAALAIKRFDIDWDNSVDKRKRTKIDEFGYKSLHYICLLPESLCAQYPEYPNLRQYKFELQLRTTLQHTWASIYHDTGYKHDIEVPTDFLRRLSRLAGLLELADQEFVSIRTSLDEYRRTVKNIVSNGQYADIELNIDSFNAYCETGVFDALNKQIASTNNIEVQEVSISRFLIAFKALGCETLEDLHNIVKTYSETAYRFALNQMQGKDINIMTSAAGIDALLKVYVLASNLGPAVLAKLLDDVYGEKRDYHLHRAERYYAMCKEMGIVK